MPNHRPWLRLPCREGGLEPGARNIALARIVWRRGAVTDLEVKMRVNAVAKLTRSDEMRDRLRELAQAGKPDDEIARVLTGEGHRSLDSADKVLPFTIHRIRLAAGIKVAVQRHRWQHDSGSLSASEVATRLGMPVNWFYMQIRKQRLLIDRQPTGTHLFPDTPSALDAVVGLRDHTITCLNSRICQPDKEGHQHA